MRYLSVIFCAACQNEYCWRRQRQSSAWQHSMTTKRDSTTSQHSTTAHHHNSLTFFFFLTLLFVGTSTGSGGPESRVSWIQQFIMVTISEIGYYFLFNWLKLFTPSSLLCTLAMQICSCCLSRLRTSVEPPFRGHPRNHDTCSLNGDVPSIEGSHTKIIWTIEGGGGQSLYQSCDSVCLLS